MTATISLTSDSCKFDLYQLSSTLLRYETLSIHDVCPHIDKVVSKSDGIEFYAIMDSNCVVVQSFCGTICNKGTSSILRVAARKCHKNRNQRPQEVSCVLRSLNPTLLWFPQGQLEGNSSVLDLKAKGQKLRAGSLYRKFDPFLADHLSIDVEQSPQNELRRARVEVDVIILRDYPKSILPQQFAELSIAVPAKEAKNNIEESVNGGKKKMVLDPISTSLIVEGIKLLLRDGYTYIKGKFSSQGNQENRSVMLKGSKLDVNQVDASRLSPILETIEQTKLSAKTLELEAQLKRFEKLHRKKSAFLLAQDEGTTAADRADVQFRLSQTDAEITEVAKAVQTIMEDLLGKDFRIE